MSNISFVFFGSSDLSLATLEALKAEGLKPALIVTSPDKPRGRKLKLTPSAVKVWSEKEDIPVFQPEKLDEKATETLAAVKATVYVIASYGKIIPLSILNLPEKGALNVHPSLLPLFRGPSPIVEQILADEKEIGVSIMLLDEEMDHGPILVQKRFAQQELAAKTAQELEIFLGKIGGELLASVLPNWVKGDLKATPQEHARATFTKKLRKEDGLLVLADNPRKNYLKFLAFQPWPGVYYFVDHNGRSERVIIKAARFEDGKFVIERVLPEGGKEIPYQDFLRGLRS